MPGKTGKAAAAPLVHLVGEPTSAELKAEEAPSVEKRPLRSKRRFVLHSRLPLQKQTTAAPSPGSVPGLRFSEPPLLRQTTLAEARRSKNQSPAAEGAVTDDFPRPGGATKTRRKNPLFHALPTTPAAALPQSREVLTGRSETSPRDRRGEGSECEATPHEALGLDVVLPSREAVRPAPATQREKGRFARVPRA